MNGLDGQITTASSRMSASAAMKSGCGRAVSAPWKSSSRTTGSQRLRTKYSWKSSQPVSVRSRVRTGSSLIGKTRGPTPRRRHRSSVTFDSVSPARRRRVRSMCTARSRSPSRNQVSPPIAASVSMQDQVSSARPQPTSRLARPASVYMTVSMSGEIARPRCSKSSPVLTTTSKSSGGMIRDRPSASLAPPTPPESAMITGTGPPRVDGPVR